MEQTMPMGEGEGQACTHANGCNCDTSTEGPKEIEHEEMQLAFLLALMPLVVLTFFGQVGLI